MEDAAGVVALVGGTVVGARTGEPMVDDDLGRGAAAGICAG